jgi:alpha-tubulin suppressor-like RCC1 family protein
MHRRDRDARLDSAGRLVGGGPDLKNRGFARRCAFGFASLLAVLGALASATGAGAERASQPSSVQAGYLDAGYYHSCAVIAGGSVRCWGQGINGKLGYLSSVGNVGDNELPSAVGPVSLGTGRTAVQVGAGEGRSCALLDNATVRCWGSGGFGGLGYGTTEDVGDNESPASRGPVNFGTGRTVKAISVGNEANCAILDNDTLKCWGQAGDGALGYGNENNVGDNETPAAVGVVDLGPSDTVKAVSAGGAFTCAILTNNTVKCWGLNDSGQVGLGIPATTAATLSIGDDPGEEPANNDPVSLPGGQGAVAVAAGSKHVCVILTGGGVACWGEGIQGKLGYGNTTYIGDNEAPATAGTVDLGSGRTAVAITAGDQHSCAILDNGTVRCWGGGFRGRTGHGSIDNIGDDAGEMPGVSVSLGAGRTATAISAGAFHTCARRDDGSVICWGASDSGTLGYGNSVDIGDNEAASAGGPLSLGSGPLPPTDTDGDGKPDSSDACPSVAGTPVNGCPNVPRTLSLAYRKGRFRGGLTANANGCRSNVRVAVMKKVKALGGPDDKQVGTDRTATDGRYQLDKKRKPGRYYAEVPAAIFATAGNCGAARSDIVRLK